MKDVCSYELSGVHSVPKQKENITMLIGSDKQVEWATKIRSELIAQWEKSPLFTKHKTYILRHPSASWWISIYKTNRSIDDICPKRKVKEEIATLEAFFS